MTVNRHGGKPRDARTRAQRVGNKRSQVPVWFCSRMSRQSAESDGTVYDLGADSVGQDPVMGQTLAEGISQVNDVNG
jgi:hypothetical protein